MVVTVAGEAGSYSVEAAPGPARAVDPEETVSHESPVPAAPIFPPPPPDDPATIVESVVHAVDGDLGSPYRPPRSLGGYRVGRRIGPARAGESFRGRARATGREVALAIVRPRWSALAAFVARFAREAQAAGQLRHPNLIAPIGFDFARGVAFVASDALGGVPLSDPLAREGLDRSARVAAILHAARALKLAHEQGVYHRDLSPAKIRVDDSGLVRLADLGVGLTPDTPEGPAAPPIPLAGSPPTPAPESPTSFFARDDIAGLGRSLDALIGGTRGDRAVPPGLASIARRMVGGGPEGGFADLGAVVRTLEAELGVGEPFTPRAEEADELEACARDFDAPPMLRVRSLLGLGSASSCALFAGLAILAGRPPWLLGLLAFLGIVAASTTVIRGIFGRDPLFDRARELAMGGGRLDLLTALAALAILGAVLASTGLLGTWIFLGMLAVGLASAHHFAIDRPIELARVEPIRRAKVLVRDLRRLGVSEDSVRRFARRQAGAKWEGLFEALFGHDALREARGRWATDAGGWRRPRPSAVSDAMIDALDARIDHRRRARDLELFGAIEERGLEARGINLLTARRRGRRIAEATVMLARRFRESADQSLGIPLMAALDRAARSPEEFLATAEVDEATGPPAWREALGLVARILFGPRTRFLLGAACLATSLLWMHQNALISADEIKQAGLAAAEDREKAVEGAREIGRKIASNVRGVAEAATRTRPLEITGLPPGLARRLDGFGLGLAGLMLLVSSWSRGIRPAAFAIPGAVVSALGPDLIEAGARPLGPTSLMAMAVGVALLGLGVVFGRSRE